MKALRGAHPRAHAIMPSFLRQDAATSVGLPYRETRKRPLLTTSRCAAASPLCKGMPVIGGEDFLEVVAFRKRMRAILSPRLQGCFAGVERQRGEAHWPAALRGRVVRMETVGSKQGRPAGDSELALTSFGGGAASLGERPGAASAARGAEQLPDPRSGSTE